MIIEISKITNDYEIIFALDPSTDNTESVILKAIEKNKKIKSVFPEDWTVSSNNGGSQKF